MIGMTPEVVVDNGAGQPWLLASFSKDWQRFATANGFGAIRFHGLRHGAATLLLASGVLDAVAISVMGHADTTILRLLRDRTGERP